MIQPSCYVWLPLGGEVSLTVKVDLEKLLKAGMGDDISY